MKIRATLCCLAASGLLLGACSEDSGTIDEPAEESASAEETEPEIDAAAFDPPMQFDTGAGVPLPQEAGAGNINLAGNAVQPLPVALSGTKAFIASANQLQIVDTRIAEILPAITPQSGTPMDPAISVFAGENPIQAPIVVSLDGKDLVVVPFLTTGEAEGTAVAHQNLEVIAVDAATGEQAFSVVTELPLVQSASYENAVVKGESGGVVVVDLDIYGSYTVAVDLAAQAVAWESAFATQAVAGDTVVGVPGDDEFNRHRSGLAIADGAVKWEDEEFGYLDLRPAGSKYVFGFGGYDTIEGGLFLVEAATGTVTSLQAEERDSGMCRFDGQTTLICNDTWGWLGAVNTETGEWLWELEPSAERSSVGITAVWHGAVYGNTDNGPVVLDALTGADAETAPGIAPWVVNEYVGIAADPNSGVSGYPAIA
ncbi:PQQ-like beta-propeller repeat protein [Glycomyces sp. TRM65418]|uniref:PQQ-like beta-propeller repeat protein n=1 Tax=Glycomyces sp. TRM65418 TaxID=2867006 RepID=UPI001CE54475|nr:PQQ-like beta-propeller repeat protein [Glycomyces sp. TRM65418]MCC3764075.1 PQQ-like beta-propeller repeat protein [Glycomyces sp. TRM65418]QZD53765.1 PQQ-like beta-propeller repeat protein [Glycomyces sp. TRM65418]